MNEDEIPVHANDMSAERVDETPKCKDDPRAPHGFDRNASHNADRYVCECEGWEPPKKEWVGLTDEEVIECLDSVALSVVETEKVVTKHLNVYNAAKVIEAKLKEKNT